MSDIDFDDESTSDDLTDAPPTLNPNQELDHTLTKVADAADSGVGAKELSSAIDDQLLASITVPEAERVSKLELKALTSRKHLEEALSDEPQDPVAVAAAKKLYTDALQDQLDFHDYLAQAYATFLTSDFQNKLINEPLLSIDEIAKLNNNIRPADMGGRFISPDQLVAARNAIDEATGKDNPGEDFFRTPARLQQHNEAVRKTASELSLPDGWDIVFDDENALAEISKIPGRLERQAAYRGYALDSRPRHLVIKHRDPALNKHNLMFELDPDDSSMMVTPDEVNAVLNALTDFHGKIDISNLQNILADSYTSNFNPTGAIDIKLGRHAPLRSGDIGVDSTSKVVINAATSTDGQLYINIDRMRLFDTPEFRKEKEGFYWNENKSSLEKIKTTLHHELGHQIQYATTDTKNPGKIKGAAEHAGEDGEVNNTYAVVSNGEHFAESIGRYISTGEATDRVKKILSENGLIKSTEPEQLAAAEGAPSQKLVMPKPENGDPNKTVEAFTLSNKIKSLKKMIADGEDLQNYLKSRGKEEDPDMAKFLKMHYRQLKGLEFIEAYRKQTGKNRVTAPYSVFEGTHPMFDTAEPSPDAEGAPSSLDHLGIDFQSATMDASGTRLPTPGAFTGEFQNIMKGAKSWKDVQERLKGKTITYFDFETTGISDYDGQDITNDSVQLGAVQVKDGKIIKRFNVYTSPESKLSEWSAKNLGRDVLDENGNRILDENGKPKTTPVTPEWLAQQKSKNDAIKEFMEFIGPNALLGGQNVPFDVEILKRMASDAGVELDIAGTIDSKDLASLLPKYDPEKGTDGPKAPDRKTGEIKATSSLGPVANFLGFEPANWHSADGDAEDAYNLVSKIIDRAAAEDNQDLSLLDFPAMKKRYEERMAEFKNVVSPNNPLTENQQKALEEFSNSNNSEISKLAKDTLATVTTRGDAAKALAELHSLQPENIAPDAEGIPDAGSRPEPSSQEALEEAYKELRAANRVQPMEPKATANKKLNGDDYAVMDILRDTMRNGSVMDIEDIQREAEYVNFSPDGSLSKTIASLKRKGILTTVPDNKNKLALTESGIEKVAIVQAGFDKERRDAEERAAARTAEVEADIAAKEAAKTPEQKAQEEAAVAEFRAKQAALDKQRLAEDEAKRLFYETNLTSSENRAMKFVEDALIDDDISNISDGSNFEKKDFEDSLKDYYENQPRLPAGETPSSLTEEIISSLKKKGFITTVRGDKDALALTKLGAENLRERLGLPSTATVIAEPENIAPDAEGTPESIKPARNEALDIDLSDFDFDDDGELEPNEIKAAAKAIAASGHGMKLDGRKSDSERAIDTNGKKISIADSTRTAQAPSQQATDLKNSIVELGSKVREAAEKKAEAKRRKELSIPDDADVKEFISNKIREIEHENQRIDTEIMNSRGQLQAMLFSEIEKEAANITEEDLKAYLREARHYGEGISEEEIAQATLDNNYRPKIGRWGIPYNISPDSKSGASFDTGNAFSYNFGNSYLNTKTTNRIRLAAVRLAEKSKNSDYPEIQKLAEEAKAKADIQAKNREKLVDIKEKRTFASRDALVETLKENGVEFDSVDMSQYIGKWEPRLRRYSENSKLSKKTRAEIEKAFQYIPKDFLLAAISYLKTTRDASTNPYAHMGRIRIIESGARAHYNSDGGNGGVIRGDDHGDFVHEFWHFFQHINPDIGALEHAFTYDRIKDQDGNLPSVEAKDWSFVFNGGDFVSSYTSKQYPRGNVGDFSPSNRSTEVGSTGMEDLFTSPGRYSTPGSGWWADAPTLIVGSGRNRSSYRHPHMDIATGIWYTDSSMTTKIPGQDLPNQKIHLKGRLDSSGEDTNFRDFNIGMLLSMLDWSSK